MKGTGDGGNGIKYIGQHVFDFVSSFRNTVNIGTDALDADLFLNDLSNLTSSLPADGKVLHIDSNNKVGFRTFAQLLADIGGGDITSVAVATSSADHSKTSGAFALTFTGGTGIGLGLTGSSTGATNGELTINSDIATTSSIGAASFSSDNFAVSGAGAVTIKTGGIDLTADVTGTLPQTNLPDDMDSDKVKQIVITTHNFQLANTTGTFFYVPFNNLNESSSGNMSNYWTRTIPPYAGTVKKIAVRSHTSLGTSCELRVSKITDTTDALTSGTHVDVTGLDMSSAHTSNLVTMSTNSFAAGNVVGVAIKRSAGTAAQVVLTIAWEYTL